MSSRCPESYTASKSNNAGGSKVLSLSLSKKRRLNSGDNGDSTRRPDVSVQPASGPIVGNPRTSNSSGSSSRCSSPSLSKDAAAAAAAIDDQLSVASSDVMEDDQEFWKKLTEMEEDWKGKQAVESQGDTIKAVPEIRHDDNDTATMMASLSVSGKKEEKMPRLHAPQPTVRRPRGEDVFTESCVKEWQGSRIKAWEGRYVNPEGYYYRFVVPGEGQQNGGWSKHEHELFMKRYNEWIGNGWKIGASWGLFSKAIPHRVGYQCMNYYRKLVSEGKLRDESYAVVDGKLKQVHKERAPAAEIPETELGPEWETEEVKQIEKNVDMWLKQYHHRSGSAATRPSTPVTKKAAPRVTKTTTPKSATSVSELIKKQPPRKNPMLLLIDKDTDEYIFMESAEPEHANLRAQNHDWEKEWHERLEAYKSFMRPFLDPDAKMAYWHAKQEWRRGLTTTEMLMKKPLKLIPSSVDESSNNGSTGTQALLSKYFRGVKAPKVDTPDELIYNVRIPNELYSGVHQITPLALAKAKKLDQEKIHYYELDDMMDCTGVLDALLTTEDNDLDVKLSPLEGILIDPPWEFYIKDGRNDGHCSWNVKDMLVLLEKVVKHMTAGLIFIWTHKLIQADVVRMMDAIDCRYVENLVWFKKSINNDPLDQPSPYFSSTKEILLMFKKGDGFELRHQRTADVIIDFELPTSQWIHEEFTEPKPAAVFDMIETLLPRAGYDDRLKRGRLLELWAKRQSPRREGWIAFHQRKHADKLGKPDAVPLEDITTSESF